MMKCRTRAYKPVQKRHRPRNACPVSQGVHHATCFSATNVEFRARAAISGRDDDRMIVLNEADVTDQPLVQNAVDEFALVSPAARKSFESRSWCGREIRHVNRSLKFVGTKRYAGLHHQ